MEEYIKFCSILQLSLWLKIWCSGLWGSISTKCGLICLFCLSFGIQVLLFNLNFFEVFPQKRKVRILERANHYPLIYFKVPD